MNAQEKRLNISGKIDFKPAKNTYLSLGANLYSRTSRDFSYWRSMFSYDDNRESSQNTYRLFGKITQKFGNDDTNDESSSATIKNAFFTIVHFFSIFQYFFYVFNVFKHFWGLNGPQGPLGSIYFFW